MPIEIKPYLRAISIVKPDKGRDDHPFNIPAIKETDSLEFHRDITFFIGENGSGKSTVLEAIAIAMNFGAQGGTANFSIADPTGMSELYKYIRLKKSHQRPRDRYFLRAESFYNVGKYLEDLAADPDAKTTREKVFRRYGGKSLHHRSHGESFMSLIVDAFGGKGLYLLDEPEAALSPRRQMAALVRMNDLVKMDSQFIIATHSPILMSFPNALIYLFDESGCRQVAFEETEHYRITKDFLNSYQKRLEGLLS